MQTNKEKAIEFRRKGMSYSQISGELGTPKSTLAGWFKHESWSHEIKNRLSLEVSWSNPQALAMLAQANRERWEKAHKQYQDEATQEFTILKDSPLFISGVMLYWGEGDKVLKNGQVKLSNTDPAMIEIFYRFLLSLSVAQENIKIWLLLYPDLVDTVQKKFWSRATRVPLSQFKKSIYIQGRHPTRRLSYGVCNIYVSSRRLKEKMIKWIELYSQYFTAREFLKNNTN